MDTMGIITRLQELTEWCAADIDHHLQQDRNAYVALAVKSFPVTVARLQQIAKRINARSST